MMNITRRPDRHNSSFTIAIPTEALDDLQRRLANRYPVEAPDDSWDCRTPVAYLQNMVAAWQRVRLACAGGPDERRTELRHRGRRPDRALRPRPVQRARRHPAAASTHLSWVVLRFLDMIGPLTDPVAYGGRPEDAFDVVIPSIPGFGFSTPLVGEGWTMAESLKRTTR